jgi:hypothetical protein
MFPAEVGGSRRLGTVFSLGAELDMCVEWPWWWRALQRLLRRSSGPLVVLPGEDAADWVDGSFVGKEAHDVDVSLDFNLQAFDSVVAMRLSACGATGWDDVADFYVLAVNDVVDKFCDTGMTSSSSCVAAASRLSRSRRLISAARHVQDSRSGPGQKAGLGRGALTPTRLRFAAQVTVHLPTRGRPVKHGSTDCKVRCDRGLDPHGNECLGWGNRTGSLRTDEARFNPAVDAWTMLPTTCAPAGVRGNSAIWTGSDMIVWGGWSIARSYS